MHLIVGRGTNSNPGKHRSPSVLLRSGTAFDLPSLRARLSELDALLSDPAFWTNPDTTLCQERGRLENLLQEQAELDEALLEAEELLSWEDEPGLFDEIGKLLGRCELTVARMEHWIMFPDAVHRNHALLTLTAGAGGTESQHWVTTMLRAYTRWSLSEGLQAELITRTYGSSDSLLKSVTMRVTGSYAYGKLRSEHGTHRFCRVSPFDSSGRVHTSFVGVDVMPEIEEDTSEIKLVESDLEVSTFRSSGPGGQHANKTDSAVRIKHLPTGIVVSCQEERSQIVNRANARKMLLSKLEQIRREEAQALLEEHHGSKTQAAFGHQIRSYELHQSSYIRDHRTNQTVYQPEKVLDGDFSELTRAFLLRKPTDSSAGVLDAHEAPRKAIPS